MSTSTKIQSRKLVMMGVIQIAITWLLKLTKVVRTTIVIIFIVVPVSRYHSNKRGWEMEAIPITGMLVSEKYAT